MKKEDQNKIDVTYDQVNHMLQVVENSRKQLPYQQDKSPAYDPKINQKISLQTLKQRIQLVNPGYPINEITNLFPGGKGEINAKDLTDMLK